MNIYHYFSYLLKKTKSLSENEKQFIFEKGLEDRNFLHLIIDILEKEQKQLKILKKKYIHKIKIIKQKAIKQQNNLKYQQINNKIKIIRQKEEKEKKRQLDLLLNKIQNETYSRNNA